MLIRSIDGKIILLKRSDYLNDKQYYNAIYQIVYLYTEKYTLAFRFN